MSMTARQPKTELEKLESRNYFLLRRIERAEEVLDLVCFLSDTIEEGSKESIKDALIKYDDKYKSRL